MPVSMWHTQNKFTVASANANSTPRVCSQMPNCNESSHERHRGLPIAHFHPWSIVTTIQRMSCGGANVNTFVRRLPDCGSLLRQLCFEIFDYVRELSAHFV